MTSRFVLALALTMPNLPLFSGKSPAQSTYIVPTASATLASGIDFASGKPVDDKIRDRFSECDHHDVCDGKVLTQFKCSTDPSRNTVFLTLAGGVLFYDAKMGIDADGSQLAQKESGTDQAATSFRYPLPDSPSLDADKIPYIVVPGGDFRTSLGIELGDIAAVIYRDRLAYAIVGDVGPKCKIGEGSMQMHEELGHPGCAKRDDQGVCIHSSSSGIAGEGLYFVFPHSKDKIISGLTPANINERLTTEGKKLFESLQPASAPNPPSNLQGQVY